MKNVPKKRKILYVWNYREWGGAQIYLLAIMKEAKGEWDVSVILPKGSSPQVLGFLSREGIPYEEIEAYVDLSRATTTADRLNRHYARFRAELLTLRHLRKYDLSKSILHIEAAPWQSWILYTVLSIRGANVFTTLHNMLPDRPVWRVAIWKARMRFVSRLPGFHMLVSNHDTRNKLKGWVGDSFWQGIPVTYTCVDPTQIEDAASMPFDRDEIVERLSIKSKLLIVLCVGQFIDRKGRWTFLEAAKIVARARQDIGFVWVAPNPPTDEEQASIDSYGLGDRFRLIESAAIGSTREEILRFYKVGDIFALPSFVEGLPISLLEAMAMGLPSISTNVYAIPEAVKPGVTGLLVEAGEAEALAGEIMRLADDERLRKQLGEAGRGFVLEHFDERAASRIAIEEYQKCFAPHLEHE